MALAPNLLPLRAPGANAKPEVGSPEWWALRLLRRLETRAATLAKWDRYYEGDQPLAFASQKFEEAFGDRFPAFTSNFCQLAVDGIVERLEVQGFRFNSPEGDSDLWEVWQENDLDAGSQQAHTEAMIMGMAYALVEPQGEGVPLITVESPLQAIVAPDPRRATKRSAGLKRWIDDEARCVLVVYLPEGVYKFRSAKAWADHYSHYGDFGRPPAGELEPGEWTEQMSHLWHGAGFEPYQPTGDDEWPLPNPMGVVPLVELANRPRINRPGQSEIKPIQSNQDAVNKYRTDALITSEFAAYPQRYLLNYEPETDEATGRAREPFRTAIDRLWTVPPADPDNPDAPEPKIGSLPAASLEPYERMIAMEVGHLSSISGLPYHYFLSTPTAVPPSGESLKSSEARLVRKIGRAQLHLGEGWEEVMRVALRARRDARAELRTAETIWQDTETRNEATRTDAVVKLHTQGIIDDELAWEMLGLSPAQIERIQERMAKAEEEAEAEQAEAPPAPPAAPPEVVPAPTGPRMGATVPNA